MSRITLVLVGKTGHGKSSTGNTMLQNISFEEAATQTDGTELLELKRRRLENNTELRVYDTPGLMSLKFDSAKIREEMDRLMNEAKELHVFCFVFNFNCRFTTEEADTVKELKAMFGERFLKDHGMIVVTHGDNCESEASKHGISTQEMFKKWCASAGPDFTQLISEVGDKTILVNNRGDFSRTSPRMASSQALRYMIQNMSNIKSPFTKSEYDNLKSYCTIL